MYNKAILNFTGLIYLVLGIIGVFWPQNVSDVYGLEFAETIARTEFRVLCSLSISVGIVFIYLAADQRRHRAGLQLALLTMTLFILARLYGLLVDGVEQPLMWQELALEFVLLGLYGFGYNKLKTSQRSHYRVDIPAK